MCSPGGVQKGEISQKCTFLEAKKASFFAKSMQSKPFFVSKQLQISSKKHKMISFFRKKGIYIFWPCKGYEVACISELRNVCLTKDSSFFLHSMKKKLFIDVSLEQGLSSHVQYIGLKGLFLGRKGLQSDCSECAAPCIKLFLSGVVSHPCHELRPPTAHGQHRSLQRRRRWCEWPDRD